MFNGGGRYPTAWVTALGGYLVLASAVGGLFYLNTDMAAYLGAVGALFSGTEAVYALEESVYPPLYYTILAGVMTPFELAGLDVTTPMYLNVTVVKLVQTTALVVAVTLGGTVIAQNRVRWYWTAFALCNPLTLLTLVLFGQADSLVVLALVGTLYGWQTKRWWLVGAGIAFGASVKVYPLLMIVPAVLRRREHAREMFVGLLPVLAFTGGVTVGLLPESYFAFVDTGHKFGLYDPSVTPTHPLWLLVVLGFESLAEAIPLFETGVVLSLVAAVYGVFEVEELNLLLPTLPVIYLYPYNPSYRWLPVAVALGYVGFVHYECSKRGRTFVAYALAVSVLGVSVGLLAILANVGGEGVVLRGTVWDTSVPQLSGFSATVSAIRSQFQFAVLMVHTAVGLWALSRLCDGSASTRRVRGLISFRR